MNRKDVFDVTDRVIVITGALGQIGRQFGTTAPRLITGQQQSFLTLTKPALI